MNAPAATPSPTLLSMRPTPLLVGVVAGAALGIATQVGQGALPDGAAALLANSGAMWLAVAFAIGAAMATPGAAAIAGGTTLVTASWVYYEAVAWFEGYRSDHRGAVIWAAAGLLAGPVAATAGRWARGPRRRGPALALIAGVLVAEGMHLWWWVGVDTLRGIAVIELAVGAGVLAVALWSATPRTWPTVVAVAAGAWTAARLATLLVDTVFLAV